MHIAYVSLEEWISLFNCKLVRARIYACTDFKQRQWGLHSTPIPQLYIVYIKSHLCSAFQIHVIGVIFRVPLLLVHSHMTVLFQIGAKEDWYASVGTGVEVIVC